MSGLGGLAASPSNGHISPMELESLAAGGDYNGDNNANKSNKNKNASLDRLSGVPSQPLQQLWMMIRLYFELYPRPMYAATGAFLTFLLYKWAPFSGSAASMRNYMTHDYTALEDNFNLQTAQVDHWCLFGGDDKCYCEDPTEAQSRSEVHGWSNSHKRNKWIVTEAIGKYGAKNIDVVFFGDQTVQSWDGLWLDRQAPEGKQISAYFNKTFQSKDSLFTGVPLGIYGDRLNNILWRIKHGEIPKSLDPKVFWLIMGTNDLALGMCSEEVVTLGIMRIAEELHHQYPTSIVVIQGILPRSNHKDGSLEGKTSGGGGGHFGRGNKDPREAAIKRAKKKAKQEAMAKANGGKQPPLTAMSPANGGGGRQLRLTSTTNNPMDVFLDNYLDQYNDTEVTNQLMEDYWGPHVPSMDEEYEYEHEYEHDQQATEERRDLEEGETKSAKPESVTVIGKPKESYTYQDKDKVIPESQQHKTKLPHFDFYLWPSIKAINKELEGFCAKHEHLVYFDADDLVLGSIGNEHYRAAHKTIITALMPNYVHLSYQGHQVVLNVLNDELKRIIYDDDEENDIETAKANKDKHQHQRRRQQEEEQQQQ
ncbi:Platelet-activating factor acetylhydrolase IB subunit gamma [Seminavis robusta]|uniref:Platelet-activating factor acetylhydrolase IB subunit gamma n=1 Tax=Seminavis robusta TaxID=568900 RepID=A0A9N8HFQ9_9STRA|nr:Platelet-activating factor acetylhydrolase IB subunit gamma [Seminavis robusta]|eukprot:Sro360_g126340.1 Platelet-activating factor acetylhydrolase IB subunit gamma (593) ;mRNA; r:57736-59638